jgi:acyl-homoserine lactone synthase
MTPRRPSGVHAMIHIVTSANRHLYGRELEEMHRLRWLFFIEQRRWSELEAIQETRGLERDEYDDERAVYLLALGDEGEVQGSMRLRPTADKALITDKFPCLIGPETEAHFGADVWEITRLMRSPAYRGSDGELRLQINYAACEFAISHGIQRYVCVVDTFLLPAMRALNRDKHRVLGLPHAYAEGEMIAVELKPDQEWLARCAQVAGFARPNIEARSCAQSDCKAA